MPGPSGCRDTPLFGSMIVYPVALLIGLVAGLLARPKGAPRAAGIAGVIAAAIAALEFSMYLGTGPFWETVGMVGVAALACFVLAIAGGVTGAGIRWFVSATIRAFRGL